MRFGCWFVALTAMLFTSLPALSQTATRQKRPPNILLILADDLGATDLGVYGSTFYETPNLDRLAGQGMRFTSAYAACPVCSPTRASLMTGKYPARVGVTDYLYGKMCGKVLPAAYIDHLPLEEITLPETLKQNGYVTWHVGKWHLGTEAYFPEKQGFDVNIAGNAAGLPRNGYFSPWKMRNLQDGQPGDYLTDRVTDESIRLIMQNKDKPFFLNYWAYAPHIPIQAPEPLVEKYKKKLQSLKLDPKAGVEEGEFFPIENKKTKRVARRKMQADPVYAAMIENLDTNIGRLLAAIEELGQTNNTIVVFTSDNGGVATAEGSPTSNLPLRDGKGFIYEGGIRVPLIVAWPTRVPAGSISDMLVTTPDYYPTLIDAAKLPAPVNVKFDGVSILPVLTAELGSPARDAIYWHYPHYGNQGGTPASAVRRGDFKLIEFLEDNHVELYNVKADISEKHDLAAGKPDLTKELRGLLDKWREEVGAKMPTPNPEYRAAS